MVTEVKKGKPGLQWVTGVIGDDGTTGANQGNGVPLVTRGNRGYRRLPGVTEGGRGHGRTLDDGQQDDDDEEEEGDVKHHAVQLVLVTRRVLYLVTDAAAGTHTHVHVEQVALWGGLIVNP